MRHPRACTQCRESKRKCKRDGIDQACTPCTQRRLRCTLVNRPVHSRSAALAPQTPAGSRDDGTLAFLSPALKEELVDLYLDKIHDRPHSLFHAVTLRSDVRDGRTSQALLLAICSAACRFSRKLGTRQLELPFMNRSKKLLLESLECISVENVQCCILIANLCAAHLNPTSEALFFRIANGMAQILGLDAATPAGLPIAEGEVRRRVWWTLVMADRWSSFGLGLSRQIPELDGPVDLPMDEAAFQSLSPGDTRMDVWSPGLWAQMILLVRLFGPIQDLNRRSASGEVGPDELLRSVDSISHQLQLWENMLPGQLRMTADNFEFHRNRGTGGAFVALHLGFYHYSTLLYFQFLEQGNSSRYADRCKTHAAAYSDLLRESRRKGDCDALYATVAHMTVVSSSVLLHTLLYGDEEELETARKLLNSNFEAILELQGYWPSCGLMMTRLVTFQTSCLLAEAHTHRLDGWMVRFLMQHSLPLEDKEFFADMQVSPRPDVSMRAQELTDQGRYTEFRLPEANSIE